MVADEAESRPTALPDGVPAQRVDALYGLPLEEFTKGRDELAKDLRQEGRREAAVWVKGLRKPTAPAWLVNQLARTQRKQARSLIEAAEHLREIHERLLAGRGNADDLRAAAERQNHAVRDLVGRASGLLDRGGRSPSRSSLDKLAETLLAVAVDEETRDGFAAGRLTRESRASGFGGLDLDLATGPRAEPLPGPGRRRSRKAATEDRARARTALKEAKAEHRERQRDVATAERVVERARREAQRVQRRLEEAMTALERAGAQEADAAARVAEAESDLNRHR